MSHITEEELEMDYYKRLKDGSVKIMSFDSRYRCPICVEDRKEYDRLKYLLHHASDLSRGSYKRDLKEKAKHLALERFIEKYYHEIKDRSEPPRKVERETTDHEVKFVWPSMGILANIKTELRNGKRVGESGSKLRDEFIRKGFSPVKVTPLWNYLGHSGFAIVDFNKDWVGFENAMAFESSFEAENCGKMAYETDKNRGEKLYGWIAREDDYKSTNIVGGHLRKHGDLKTVFEKQAEDRRIDSKLVSTLTDTLKTKNKSLKEIESKYYETVTSFNQMVSERDAILNDYNEEKRKMQQNERDHFEKIMKGHEKFREDLEGQKKELESREKELQQRKFHNDCERRNLVEEKKMIERATLEQKKADEEMFLLAKKQKRQKEKLHKKIIDLEKKLDKKQALELMIERYRGALEVMKHMGADEDMKIKKEMDEIKENLKEKEEEMEALEEINQALIVKERRSNDELQEARKVTINGLRDSSNRAFIGVKRMGELNGKPFLNAAKRKFSDEEARGRAVELCSMWDAHLRDPNWHPFKVITDKGKAVEIINEEDEKLKNLKDELGDEAYEAVVKALKEVNEYNASGRYIIAELWNFKEGRRARLKEGVDSILKKWKLLKRNRN